METIKKQYPGFWQAVGLIILQLFLYILIGFVYVIIEKAFMALGFKQLTSPLLKSSILGTMSFLIVLWFGLYKTNRPFKEVFPLIPFNPLLLLALLVFLIGFSVLQSEFKNMWERYIGFIDIGIDEIMEEMVSGSALSFLVSTLIAPFVEEFFFRGMIFQGFTGRYRLNKAVFLSSVLFAAIHVAPFRLFNSFIIGVFLAWLLIKTGSLWPCILAHSIINGLIHIQFIAEPVFNIKITGYTLGCEYHFHPMWFNIMGLFFFISGGMLLMLTLRPNRNVRLQDVKPRLNGQIAEQD